MFADGWGVFLWKSLVAPTLCGSSHRKIEAMLRVVIQDGSLRRVRVVVVVVVVVGGGGGDGGSGGGVAVN